MLTGTPRPGRPRASVRCRAQRRRSRRRPRPAGRPRPAPARRRAGVRVTTASARRSTAASSSSAGTTSVARPQSPACSPVSSRAVSTRSFVRIGPSWRTSRGRLAHGMGMPMWARAATGPHRRRRPAGRRRAPARRRCPGPAVDLGDGQRPHAADGVHGLAAEVDAGLDRAVEGQEPLPNTLNPLQTPGPPTRRPRPDVATRVEPRRGVDQATEQRVVDDAAPSSRSMRSRPTGPSAVTVTPAKWSPGTAGHASAPRRTASRRPCRPNEVALVPVPLRESGRSSRSREGNGCGRSSQIHLNNMVDSVKYPRVRNICWRPQAEPRAHAHPSPDDATLAALGYDWLSPTQAAERLGVPLRAVPADRPGRARRLPHRRPGPAAGPRGRRRRPGAGRGAGTVAPTPLPRRRWPTRHSWMGPRAGPDEREGHDGRRGHRERRREPGSLGRASRHATARWATGSQVPSGPDRPGRRGRGAACDRAPPGHRHRDPVRGRRRPPDLPAHRHAVAQGAGRQRRCPLPRRPVHPAGTYRVRGRTGGAVYVSFTVEAGAEDGAFRRAPWGCSTTPPSTSPATAASRSPSVDPTRPGVAPAGRRRLAPDRPPLLGGRPLAARAARRRPGPQHRPDRRPRGGPHGTAGAHRRLGRSRHPSHEHYVRSRTLDTIARPGEATRPRSCRACRTSSRRRCRPAPTRWPRPMPPTAWRPTCSAPTTPWSCGSTGPSAAAPTCPCGTGSSRPSTTGAGRSAATGQAPPGPTARPRWSSPTATRASPTGWRPRAALRAGVLAVHVAGGRHHHPGRRGGAGRHAGLMAAAAGCAGPTRSLRLDGDVEARHVPGQVGAQGIGVEAPVRGRVAVRRACPRLAGQVAVDVRPVVGGELASIAA